MADLRLENDAQEVEVPIAISPGHNENAWIEFGIVSEIIIYPLDGGSEIYLPQASVTPIGLCLQDQKDIPSPIQFLELPDDWPDRESQRADRYNNVLYDRSFLFYKPSNADGEEETGIARLHVEPYFPELAAKSFTLHVLQRFKDYCSYRTNEEVALQYLGFPKKVKVKKIPLVADEVLQRNFRPLDYFIQDHQIGYHSEGAKYLFFDETIKTPIRKSYGEVDQFSGAYYPFTIINSDSLNYLQSIQPTITHELFRPHIIITPKENLPKDIFGKYCETRITEMRFRGEVGSHRIVQLKRGVPCTHTTFIGRSAHKLLQGEQPLSAVLPNFPNNHAPVFGVNMIFNNLLPETDDSASAGRNYNQHRNIYLCDLVYVKIKKPNLEQPSSSRS